MIHNETIDLLLAHSSVRQYLDKPVPQEVVDTILKCTQRAPTSSYLQSFDIIQVEDKDKRAP